MHVRSGWLWLANALIGGLRRGFAGGYGRHARPQPAWPAYLPPAATDSPTDA